MPRTDISEKLAAALVNEILQPAKLVQMIPDGAFESAKKIIQNTMDAGENQDPDMQAMTSFTLRSVEAVEDFKATVMVLRAEILPLIKRKRAELEQGLDNSPE